MTEEKKKQYFYLSIGYIGIFLILIACLRYLLIVNDMIGQSLMLFGLMSIGSFFKYFESQLLSTTKEKRIFKGFFYGSLIIIFIIGCFLIYNSN